MGEWTFAVGLLGRIGKTIFAISGICVRLLDAFQGEVEARWHSS
jgi:hypothetical protein